MRYRLVPTDVALALVLTTGGEVGAPRHEARPSRCFRATGFCIAGRFLTHWEAHGGLALNGYPLTNERTERLDDRREYLVQYFERARFEYHPEHIAPFDILLGQFGRRLLAEVDARWCSGRPGRGREAEGRGAW